MPILRPALAALALSLMLQPVAAAQEGGTTDSMRGALAAGWKASFICSGRFVAGQSREAIDRNDLSGIYPDFIRAFDALPDAEVDETRKLVSVTYSPNMPPRIAAYRPGYGCTQLPVGAGEGALDFLPRFAGWPDVAGQDRGSAIGSNVRVSLRLEEAERLENPL
ncbi:MAG: serine hydrolase, partial [Hyphomonas sp.]